MLKQSSPTLLWPVRKFLAAAELRAEKTHAAPLPSAIYGSDKVVFAIYLENARGGAGTMAPARCGLWAKRTDDVEDEPRNPFRHGLLAGADSLPPVMNAQLLPIAM